MEPFKILDLDKWSMSSHGVAHEVDDNSFFSYTVLHIDPQLMVRQTPYKTPDKKHKTLSKLIKLKDSLEKTVDPSINKIHECLEFCITQINKFQYSLTPYGIESLNKFKRFIDGWNTRNRIIKSNFGNNIRNTIDVIMGESDGDQ